MPDAPRRRLTEPASIEWRGDVFRVHEIDAEGNALVTDVEIVTAVRNHERWRAALTAFWRGPDYIIGK
jgi:hypothetical protein